MSAVKPTRPPGFDARGFSKRLYERVTQTNGTPYAVFDYEDDAANPIGFPRWKQWVQSLRDAVNANAVYLDDVKKDLDDHRVVDLDRHRDLSARVTALEDAQTTVPFPGSG